MFHLHLHSQETFEPLIAEPTGDQQSLTYPHLLLCISESSETTWCPSKTPGTELTFSPWPPARSARGQIASQGRTEPQTLDFIVMRNLGDYPCLSRYRGEGQGQGQAQTHGRARPGDRISSQFRALSDVPWWNAGWFEPNDIPQR